MNNGEGQFHYGQHGILDPEGYHKSYPKTVEERLSALNDKIHGWSKVCLCEQKKTPTSLKYKPTWKVNEMLDLVSLWIEIDITALPPGSWTYFISTFAMTLNKDKSKAISL